MLVTNVEGRNAALHHDETNWPGYVDVTVGGFAAHTAYLDPEAGTGYLVKPLPENDVPAPRDPFVEVAA
jgi:hypothetical protein